MHTERKREIMRLRSKNYSLLGHYISLSPGLSPCLHVFFFFNFKNATKEQPKQLMSTTISPPNQNETLSSMFIGKMSFRRHHLR